MAAQSLFLGTLAFAAYLFLIAVALRTSRRSPAAVSMGLSVGIYVLALAGSSIATSRLLFWHFSAAYWFVALSFLMVFGAVYKSISLRILLELLERTGASDTYDALLERYVAGASFRDRLQVMIGAGLAAHRSDGYVLTTRGRLIARAVGAMQQAFGITRSG